jgi:hypothetical protein
MCDLYRQEKGQPDLLVRSGTISDVYEFFRDLVRTLKQIYVIESSTDDTIVFADYRYVIR